MKLTQDPPNGATLALVFCGLRRIHQRLGDLRQVISMYLKSLRTSEEMNDHRSMAESLRASAGLWEGQGRCDTALECATRSLKLIEEIGEQSATTTSFRIIANILSDGGMIDTAMVLDEKSFLMFRVRRYRRHDQGVEQSGCDARGLGGITRRQASCTRKANSCLRSWVTSSAPL